MKNKPEFFSRVFLFLCILTLWISQLISPAFAQQQGMSPEDRAKHQTEILKTELKLTPAQEPKVYAVNLKFIDKMHGIRDIADTAVRRKSFEALNKQRDAEYKTILTADQFKLYQKFLDDMKAKRQQQGKQGQHK